MSLLLFAACDNVDTNGKSIAESGAKTDVDSISYYMGVTVAGMYDQMAAQDSTLKTDEGKAAYMKAFAKALSMFDGKDEAQVAGMMAGLQVAYQMREMNKTLELNLNCNMLATGLAYAIHNDSIAKSPEVMQYLQTAMTRVQEQKMDKDRKAAQASMQALTKSGYTKISESLYEKVLKPGDGAAVKVGDRLKVTITAKDGKGNPMESLPLPEEMVVGQTFGADSPLTTAINRMRVGGQSQFAIPAVDMFKGRQNNMGLESTDAVVFDVTVNEVLPAEPKKEATAVTPGQPVQIKAAPAAAPQKGNK